MEQTVKGDGTITLWYSKTFHVAGKTRGQVEKEIHDAYVPDYWVNATVTVSHQVQSRFYYVGGEVKAPGRQVYIGRISVTRAIQSAGDFTDWANKKKVQLIRSNGEKKVINCVKALEKPELDLEVFPGDKNLRSSQDLLMLTLNILSGTQAGRSWAARRFPVRIGRAEDANLRLEDDGVWDEHAVIRLQGREGFFVQAQPNALVSVNANLSKTLICAMVT